ncbi:MAG: glycosyltransferase family 2 protein [Lachnospiraceae bacterium]|nr:glycosyltransferase family 2 protein [Lachnospiraceae bacterium]
MKETDTKPNILFSVIIPHYNSPVLLKKLLQSIPMDEDLEVIVVDDRSDQLMEELEAAIRLLKERNGIFLRNETGKKGAGTCRNLGLAKASGEWLIFADADDYFLEDAFPVIRQACNETDADLLFFPPCSVYLDTGEPAERHKQYAKFVNDYRKENSTENEVRLRYQFLPPWSKVYRRSLIAGNHISFEEVPVSNDVMFSIQAAYAAKKIAAYPQTFYCVTRTSNTLTKSKNRDWLRVRVQVFVERYSFLKDRLKKEEFRLLGITGKYWILMAILDGYGIREVFYILRLYKQNHVKLFQLQGGGTLMNIREMLRVTGKHAREKKHL